MEDLSSVKVVEALEQALKSKNAETARAAELELIERAEQGDVKCAEVLTSAYSDGEPCVPKNDQNAYRYTKILADAGSSFYQYWLAKLKYATGDFPDALSTALASYHNGSAQGGVFAARMLIEGVGSKGRAQEGAELLKELIAESNLEAQLALAYYLLRGNLIPQDIAQAYEYASNVHAAYYEARQYSVSSDEAAAAYYVLGYSGYLMRQKGKDVKDWQTWIKKSADMGYPDAKNFLVKNSGASTKMESTIKGNYEKSQIAPDTTEITYVKYRTAFLATFVVGIGFTSSIVFMALGIPLLVIGTIATFGFKDKGVVTIVAGQGIRFKDGSGVQQIPFSEISRVSWEKLHPWLSVYKVTLDTKGRTVIVAKNVSQPVAQDLQQAILNH